MTRILKETEDGDSLAVYTRVVNGMHGNIYRHFTSKNILTALLSMCQSWHSITLYHTSCVMNIIIMHEEEQLPTHLEPKEVHGNHIGGLLTVCG